MLRCGEGSQRGRGGHAGCTRGVVLVSLKSSLSSLLGEEKISLAIQWCLSLTAQPFIPEDCERHWHFFSTPLTVSWNKQRSHKGLLPSISGSFPPPVQLVLYISHRLLAVLLLAKLEVSDSYLGHRYNAFCLTSVTCVTVAQLLRKIKHLPILPLSETPSLSPGAASRKYTVSCDNVMSLLHHTAVAAASSPRQPQLAAEAEWGEWNKGSFWVSPIADTCASPAAAIIKLVQMLVQVSSGPNTEGCRSIFFPH